MKSIRHEILRYLSEGPKLMDDLVTLMEEPKKRISDNVSVAITDGLVSRSRDDVTGLPLYSITPAGKSRLASGVGSSGGKPKAISSIPKKAGSQTHQKYPLPSVTEEEEKESLPEADAGLLAKANRMLSERLDEIYKAVGSQDLSHDSVLAEINALKKELGDACDQLHAIAKELDVSTHAEIIPAIALLHNIETERDEWQSLAKIMNCNTPEKLRQYVNEILKERRAQPGISPADTGNANGYAVMIMDGVEIYDSVEDASESALGCLRHDPGVGYRIAVVEVVKIAENAIVQRWLEAA